MGAGFHYDLVPVIEQEEKYDVKTGIRRRGPFVIDTTNLAVDSYVPSFTPIYADLYHHTCQVVRNMKVSADYANGDTALTIQIAKGSLAYVGMFIGNGSNGAQVTAIDNSNSLYDTLTIKAAFGANLSAGDVLFETKTVAGKTQSVVANSALYERVKIETGINNVALLRTAAEIDPIKLTIPFSSNDKANLQGWFQFNE